jgi:tRNA isopentenyl-2-thiomethyl-A-37 hydroxylase MiaE
MSRENCLEGLIGQIVADTALHARWLNTFSYLEYVGFRKIVKSQRADALTAAILGHACEEGRHALGLKKLAVKLGGTGFDSYAPQVLLCGEEAEAYFQDLDQFCDEAFADRNVEERVRLAYAYVTWLVERRALDVYGLYKNALRDSEIARKLGGLLAEETKHLSDIEALLQVADPDFAARSKEFEAVESALYEVFVAALTKELTQKTLVPSAVAS